MIAVNVIYHHFPHYRAAVIHELATHGKHNYKFWGSLHDFCGIKAYQGNDIIKINPLEFKQHGRFWQLKGYWPAVFDNDTDALIILSNPNLLTSWVIAIIGRIIGKKIIFWGHGWLKMESWPKSSFRKFYYHLSHMILVYGERAKSIGISSGYPAEKIKVIYNSLNFDASIKSLKKIEDSNYNKASLTQSFFQTPTLPLIICTARITHACRFDILFNASAELTKQDRPVNILLVGEGPEEKKLIKLAKQLSINVHFLGACYDEDILARLIYWSDLTVSPGKIGLTAIHSLTYGTPAITHDDFDSQMPEVEVIKPGITGDLFKHGDYIDLALKMQSWMDLKKNRSAIRHDCQAVICAQWNPENQRRLIDQAISDLFQKGGT